MAVQSFRLHQDDINLIKQALEQSLEPIKNDIRSIKERLDGIEVQIKRIKKAATDDILAVNKNFKKFKVKMGRLEKQIKLLQAQRA